ncbi:MAG TPA: phosphodiester glycosidase family protein [Marmoricola sp.]|nr:phosphodiester glycosidase family protein [Marmoricola sp.]
MHESRRRTPERRLRLPFWRKRWVHVVLAAFAAVLIWFTWTVIPYLTAPGGDSLSARISGWARDHGLGMVVVALEKLQYDLNPPKVGGAPPPIAAPWVERRATSSHAAGPNTSRISIGMRPAMIPPASLALPHEGQWTTLAAVNGQPAVQAAFVRPDSTHTSYLTGVVWMSHKLLRFNLHPGYSEPGGSWSIPNWIPPTQRKGLLATWNGAFKLTDAHGGFYLNGKTAGSLVNGDASEVFYKDGTMAIGSWNREVHLASNVVGVRQNLALLIDNGQIVSNIDTNPQINWGLTLGGKYYIFRSGLGITAQGDLIYVSGDALSAGTLADILKRAGAVRAMELDINPAWVSFMSYQAGNHPSNPTPHSLLNDYQRPADRYYTPTSRDFVAVYAR